MADEPKTNPELLNQVFDCIQLMQSRGQVVTSETLTVTMERKYGVADQSLINAATKELEATGRIASPPLFTPTE